MWLDLDIKIKKIITRFKSRLRDIKIRIRRVFGYINKKVIFYRLPIALVILFILVLLLNKKIPNPIPSLSLFSDINLSVQYLAGISSSVSTILAIFFATFFLIYELSLKDIGEKYRNYFALDRSNIEPIILYLSVMVFASLSSVINIDPIRNFNLLVFTLLLFFFSLLMFPSYLVSSLTNKAYKDKVNSIVGLIPRRGLYDFAGNLIAARVKSERDIFEATEISPLYVCKELLIQSIKSKNFAKARDLFIRVVRIFAKEIKNSDKYYERRVIDEYRDFCLRIFESAIENKDIQISEIILSVYQEIYELCIEKKIEYYIFRELNDTLESMTMLALKNSYSQLASRASHILFNLYCKQLEENTPREEEIFSLNVENASEISKDDPDHEKFLMWDLVNGDYSNFFSKVGKVAISNNNRDLIWSISYIYELATGTIIASKKLGDKQKKFLLSHFCFEVEELVDRLLEQNLLNREFISLPFGYSSTKSIEQDKDYSKILLISSCKMRIKALTKKQLRAFEINQIGSEGRGLISQAKTDDDIFAQATRFILRVFSRMREILETDKELNFSLYIELIEQVNSFDSWNKNLKKSSRTMKLIKQTRELFKKEAIAKKLEKASKLEWEKISKDSKNNQKITYSKRQA